MADLLTLYGVTDQRQREGSIGLEQDSSLIRTYEAQFIPGLLQTEGCAREVIQLGHLIELAERPNITLQVVTFGIGGHAAAGGLFTILRFAEPDLPDIVYLNNSPARSTWRSNRTSVTIWP